MALADFILDQIRRSKATGIIEQQRAGELSPHDALLQYAEQTGDMGLAASATKDKIKRDALSSFAQTQGGSSVGSKPWGGNVSSSPLIALAQAGAIEPSEAITGALRQQAMNQTAGGGVTGALAQRLMKDNPKLSFADALSLANYGSRQGLSPTKEGGVAPLQGLTQSLEDIQKAKESGKQKAQLEIAPQVEGAKTTAKIAATKKAQLPKQLSTIKTAQDKANIVFNKIAEARKLAKDNWSSTGLSGAVSGYIPATPAYDLEETISTINANMGFSALSEMRANSPTGGALGQVSDTENKLLQSIIASLQKSQSKEQFLSNLDLVEDQYKKSMVRIKEAYDRDVKEFGKDSMPNFFTDNIGASAGIKLDAEEDSGKIKFLGFEETK